MAKTKTARLSLTLPKPVKVPEIGALSPKSLGNEGSGLFGTNPDAVDAEHELDYVLVAAHPIRELSAPLKDSSNSLSRNLPHRSATPTSPALPISPKSPTFTSLPPYPTSPEHTPKHAHNPSKSFFTNLKASKSSAKIQSPESTIRKVSDNPEDDEMSLRKLKSLTNLGRRPMVDPDAPAMPSLGAIGHPSPSTNQIATIDDHVPSSSSDHSDFHRPLGDSASAEKASTPTGADVHDGKKKDGSMFTHLMKKNHSNRNEEIGESSKSSVPTTPSGPESNDLNPVPRSRSAHRNASPHSDPGISDGYGYTESRVLGPQLNNQRSQNFRDGGSGLFNRAKKAAEGIGKVSTRMFKNKEQDSEPEKPTGPPPNYLCNVINQDLIHQTRITRIVRRLEDSKDKTEFWLPALPWRCIDFLNNKAMDSEGLYRVSARVTDVELWKWKFDTDHDINLLEEEALYDVNIIANLFKAWLRELPDVLLPMTTQDELSRHEGASWTAPQALRDELSQLPPWNYYLLFAITCHLSLLQTHVVTNRMNHTALQICFAQALKMNNDCFRWLVTDWHNCWGQGCWTEKDALIKEYHVLDFMEPRFNAMNLEPHAVTNDDNSLALSSDSRSAYSYDSHSTNNRPGHLDLNQGMEDAQLHANDRVGHSRNASQLPELTFPQPISPFHNTEHIR